MSDPSITQSAPALTREERLNALSPEEKLRIGMAMQFLLDLKTLHNEGMQLGTDLLEGKVPAVEVGMKMMDFERSLRIAANEILKRPTRVVHAQALQKGETKLDEDPWVMRVRIKASEARKAREETAREERFKALTSPPAQAEVTDEPEEEIGPRP